MFLKYTIYKSKEILIIEKKIIRKYAVSLWYNCKPVLRFLKGFSKNKKKKWDFAGGSDSKASVYNAGDPGSIPALGRSPGEGNGNPLQYYCLENPMDEGAW